MSERDKNAAVKRNSPAREIWRRFKKNKAAMLGLGRSLPRMWPTG